MNEEQLIRRDRMRYKKNKLSANLTLLAIVLDVLYFVNLYQNIGEATGPHYNNFMIGISIVYNLIFLLTAFLSEEGVKNYKKNYSIPLLILGVIQIARIFIIPMGAHAAELKDGGPVMADGQFIYIVVLLILCAACLFAAAVINFVKCTALESHMKMLEGRSAGTQQALAGKGA